MRVFRIFIAIITTAVVTFVPTHMLVNPGASAAGQILLQDDFSNANNLNWTFYNRYGEIKDGHLWIDGSYLPNSVLRDGWALTHLGEVSWTDYSFSFTFNNENSDGSPPDHHMASAFFRVANEIGNVRQSMYRVDLWNAGDQPTGPSPCSDSSWEFGHISLNRYDDGDISSSFGADGCDSNSHLGTNTARIEVRGGEIKVFVNGKLMLTHVDPNPIPYGGVGVGEIWEMNGWFDDVVVQELTSPKMTLARSRGIVHTWNTAYLNEFPANSKVYLKWDGTVIASGTTDASGAASVRFRVPYAPKGRHTIRAVQPQQRRSASTTYEAVPRIKLIPNNGKAGDEINVSLRGYAKKEIVRIRWQHGTSWTTLATVLTSNTGSANINVQVPDWSAATAKVRGDSTNRISGGRAQTTFLRTDGGIGATSTPSLTTTETPTETTTPEATPSETATSESTHSATAEPTMPPTEIPAQTETPTPAPTETPTQIPTETPTPSPTATGEGSP